jgi:hypothetical protein
MSQIEITRNFRERRNIVKVFDWLIQNEQWLFSGIGVAIVSWIGALIFKRNNSSSSQTIRSGNNSTNFQAGRDVNIGSNKKGTDVEE